MKIENKYDICIVSFSDLTFDARTINLVKVCIKLNLKVLVISTNAEIKNIQQKNINFDNIIIPVSSKNRMLINWVKFVHRAGKILKQISYSMFWASDLYSLVTVRYINKTQKKELKNIVYDSREIYSALSTLADFPIKQKIITYIEKKHIRYVHDFVVSGQLDADYLKKFYNIEKNIYVLYNYPNYKEFINSDIIRQNLQISADKTILLYQGMLLAGRGLIPVMDAIKISTKYVLVILGAGKYEAELRKHAELLNISSRVYFSGNIPYEELHSWTCSADVGLCNIEPISKSYYYALPNKLFEYLQARVPVLVTNLPAMANIVNSQKCGVVISTENNPNEILMALDELSNNNHIYKNNIEKLSQKFYYEAQLDLIKQLVIC